MKTISDARTAAAQIGREAQALFAVIAANHLFEAGLVDRHLAGLRACAIFDSSLSTQMTVFPFSARQAPDDEPDVPGSDDGDFHFTIRY